MKVLDYFYEIAKIPRGSGNEQQISEYLMNFAKERNLYCERDKYMNVIIRKPQNGLSTDTVTLQAHMDMVCEKNQDLEFDFTKDAIQTYIDGDFLRAKGTTLGADNGIAMAMMLYILDDNTLVHPELEFLFTADEEAGMTGALNFDYSKLKGKRLLNLDSEEEGYFFTSCAGGARCEITFPFERAYHKVNQGSHYYCLRVRGLKGGHSGLEIDKGHANANVLMARLLNAVFNNGDTQTIYLLALNGGLKENAIARESASMLLIYDSVFSKINNAVSVCIERIKSEYAHVEPDLTIEFIRTDEVSEGSVGFIPFEISRNIITALCIIPSDVLNMSLHTKGLVETSNNIGILRTEDELVKLTCALRSSVKSRKEFIKERLSMISESLGANARFYADYPAWSFSPESPVRDIATKLYLETFGKEPILSAVHAGLECGVFWDRTGIDMISFGPDLHGVHSPDECLSISSTLRVMEFLLKLLTKL